MKKSLLALVGLASLALARAVPSCNKTRVAKIPMIAMTTNNSTKVKPFDIRETRLFELPSSIFLKIDTFL